MLLNDNRDTAVCQCCKSDTKRLGQLNRRSLVTKPGNDAGPDDELEEERVEVDADTEDVEHFTPKPTPSPVKDFSNSKNPAYGGLWVAHVTPAHPTGKIAQAFMKNESKHRNLNKIKVRRFGQSQRAPHSTRRAFKAHNLCLMTSNPIAI